jgi:dynein heavy chain, axonemal
MEGLCYAFQEDGNVKPKNDKEALKSQDFWDYAKKFLLNDKLIKRIKVMKIDAIRAIHPSKIAKLQVFIQNPLFEREKVFNASMAAGNLAEWVRAVLATYEAIEIIEPKKAELAEAETKLAEAEEIVKLKRITLDESL